MNKGDKIEYLDNAGETIADVIKYTYLSGVMKDWIMTTESKEIINPNTVVSVNGEKINGEEGTTV